MQFPCEMSPFKNQFNPDASKGEGGTEQWLQVQSNKAGYARYLVESEPLLAKNLELKLEPVTPFCYLLVDAVQTKGDKAEPPHQQLLKAA